MTDHELPPEMNRPGGPPPPPPGAGPAAYCDPAAAGLAPHRGILILVLGIVSWVTGCFVLGVIAWAMGNRDLCEMEEGRMDPSGYGATQGGRITGMIHVIFSCVGFLVGLVVMILMGLFVLQAGN